MALPATTMEPAYDFKPVITLKATNAALKGQVIFTNQSAENAVAWSLNGGAI